MRQDDMLGMLPRLYRGDPWLGAVLGAIGAQMDRLEKKIKILHENRFFDGMTFALPIWERIAGIRARAGMSDGDRRSALRAKWLTNRKCDEKLLEDIAGSWMEDTVDVGFAEGYITIDLVGFDVILDNLDEMLGAIENVKPAHLPLSTTISYPHEGVQYIGFALSITDEITI